MNQIPVVDVTEDSSEYQAYEATVNSIADLIAKGPMPMVFLAIPQVDGKLPTVAATVYALDEQLFGMTVGLLSVLGRQRLGNQLDILPPEAQQIAAQVEGMKMVNQYLKDVMQSTKAKPPATPASDAAGTQH